MTDAQVFTILAIALIPAVMALLLGVGLARS